ncbi:GTPase activating protein (GAP) for Rho1p [Basidiobolus ranarum]|uniref:GTPase activating protein (GAP) for Rho1p n=1 Tax=Basidiobolus ranarum TaxID=34480 RepID=A0ABR2W0Z6_9FUNG
MSPDEKPKRSHWEQISNFFLRKNEVIKPTLKERWKDVVTRTKTMSARKLTIKKGAVKKAFCPKDITKTIFGVPVAASIRYAGARINIRPDEGYLCYTMPIVIVKCGEYLRRHVDAAQGTKGIFRVNGSARRVNEIQSLFDLAPDYGQNVSLESYTVHDAANLFRRYLNSLPEPVIVHQLYFLFRKVYDEYHQDEEKLIRAFQASMVYLPHAHQALLIYILDLLGFFAAQAEQTLMNTSNLASVFQPCILAHPTHELNPEEYKISQSVVACLIKNHHRLSMARHALERQKEPPSTPIKPPSPVTERPHQVISGLKRSKTTASPPLNRQLIRTLSLGKSKNFHKTKPMELATFKIALVDHGKLKPKLIIYQQHLHCEPTIIGSIPITNNIRRSLTLPNRIANPRPLKNYDEC